MTSSSAYRQFVRPWLTAARALAPRRSILSPTRESVMNILGLQISVSPATSRQKWARRIVALGAANAVVLGGGVAYAVWTSTGTGAGTSKAATFQAITITGGTAPAGQLYPGLVPDGSTVGGDLKVVTTNPNPFAVVAKLTFTVASGCTTPAITLKSGTTVTLAANSSAVAQTLSKVVGMGTTASDDCQNATITVNVSTASVSS